MNQNDKKASQFLKGDLDNIILTALRKEPSRRYASVTEFSEDITKYLNGLPVSARQNTFFYRASKFYARNKTASIVGICLALSLVLGIIATTWQAIIANQQRDRAEKRFQDVRKLSNSLLFEITPRIEQLEGSTEAREILVKRALEYLDSLSNELQDDLTLQAELAAAFEKVGDVQGNPKQANLGDLQGGIKSYEKAQNIRLALAKKMPEDAETQRLLAVNLTSIGDFKWWASDINGALNDYEKSIEILTKLVEQNPDNETINANLVNSFISKNRVISYNGSYQEAINLNKELVQKVENLEKKFPQSVVLNRYKALTLVRIGYDLSWLERYDILDEYVKKSLAIYEPLLAADSNNLTLRRDLNYAYFQAGGIYVESDPPLARQYIIKSIELSSKTSENDRLNLLAKFDLAQSYSKLGEIDALQNKFSTATEPLLKAEKILTELTTAEPKHDGYKYALANTYSRLASVQDGNRDYQNALLNYQKAINKQIELTKLDPANTMPIRSIAINNQDIAAIYEKLKQNDKALEFYQKSVEMFEILEQKGAIGDYDRKYFEKSKNALVKLQK